MTVQPTSASTSLVMLDPLERRVITYLRLLRSGPVGRAEVEQDLLARTGPGAERALDHLDRLQDLVGGAVDRSLEIGSVEDVGATKDEMLVAELIAAAAEGDPERCRLHASRAAGPAGHEPLARAAELAAGTIGVGEIARCSCGQTSAEC